MDNSIEIVDIFSESYRKLPNPTSFDLDYLCTVHKDDYKIMNHLNLKKYNAFVAGGAALQWYQNLPVGHHDIDIWFSDLDSMKEMEKHISSFCVLKFSSVNAQTYEIEVDGGNDYRIQLIVPRENVTVQQIIDSFDITVCQIATDGINWWVTDDFSQDLVNRRLKFVKYTPKTVRRLIKYWTYGFHPDSDTLKEITSNPQIQWNYESSLNDDYDHVG